MATKNKAKTSKGKEPKGSKIKGSKTKASKAKVSKAKVTKTTASTTGQAATKKQRKLVGRFEDKVLALVLDDFRGHCKKRDLAYAMDVAADLAATYKQVTAAAVSKAKNSTLVRLAGAKALLDYFEKE